MGICLLMLLLQPFSNSVFAQPSNAATMTIVNEATTANDDNVGDGKFTDGATVMADWAITSTVSSNTWENNTAQGILTVANTGMHYATKKSVSNLDNLFIDFAVTNISGSYSMDKLYVTFINESALYDPWIGNFNGVTVPNLTISWAGGGQGILHDPNDEFTQADLSTHSTGVALTRRTNMGGMRNSASAFWFELPLGITSFQVAYIPSNNSNPMAGELLVFGANFSPASNLPVELSNFTARPNSCDVNLNWSAETEQEFSHYELQKAVSGTGFKTIFSVNGKGDKAAKNYAFTDTEAGRESYYRLKLVDLDGSFEYSKTVHAVTECGAGNGEFSLSPNPISAGEQLSVEFQSKENIRTFYVLNSVGSLVRTIEYPAEEGYNNLKLDLSDLPAGLYFFSDMEQNTTRFLKQ